MFFASGEEVFRLKARSHGVSYFHAPAVSATYRAAHELSNKTATIFSYLHEPNVRGYINGDWVLFVNPCLPFLTVETIDSWAHDKSPAFGVVREWDYYLQEVERDLLGTGKPLVGGPVNWDWDLSHIDTKAVDPVLRFAHAGYRFDPEHLRKHGFYWDWRNVRFIVLSNGLEVFDVDTEFDFEVAEILWQRHGKTRSPISVSTAKSTQQGKGINPPLRYRRFD